MGDRGLPARKSLVPEAAGQTAGLLKAYSLLTETGRGQNGS